MAMAVAALKKEQVSRIVLTRPAVEAGEALGFLPGALEEKILPYLRPLYDALYDMLETDEIQKFMDRGIIEIAPLAYMRGRTLNHSFVVLDEAQNTTAEQMFMFLTRLGNDSKCVITGDRTQIDLPRHKRSGLLEAVEVLQNVEGLAIRSLSRKDVVRHPLVQKIINAYELHREAAPEA
jgi:phosphate starvation-inducible PhoH-like protein